MLALNPSHRTQTIFSLVILATLLIVGLATSNRTAASHPTHATLVAQGRRVEMPVPTPEEPLGEGPWVVRAYYADRQMVNELAAWREPWEVHHDQGYLIVDVTRTAFDRLQELDFRLELDERLTMALRQPSRLLPEQASGIPGYPCYRTVEETFSAVEAIVAQHPELAVSIDIGDTWEKTTPGGNAGDDMMVLRLTNSTIPGPKPKLFIMSSVHAREYTPAELVTRFAELLVGNYGVDADVTWLLDYHEIHLLLQANPDGRKRVEAGETWRWWRKNANQNHCADGPWPGVDLNRNFEFQWGCCGGSSTDECSEVFRGPGPGSEPETQSLQNYVRAQFPDQREDALSAAAPITTTGIVLDIHSYSELVMWPWGARETPAPNSTALQTLGRKFAYFNQYTPQQASSLYLADGTTDGFAYGELGLAAYTFELGTYFFQECDTFENTILPDNLPALVYAAKVARTPYVTPAGPETLDPVVAPDVVTLGEIVQLTATVDDTRYSSANGSEPTQEIVAAEYYIDAPPETTMPAAIAHPMTALDGAFDEQVETVQGSIDTADLGLGRHTVFVRGRDADGNWGAISAAFLHLVGTNHSYLPVVTRQD